MRTIIDVERDVTDVEGGSLTEREVRRIVELIEALERSRFDRCELEVDGLKLTLGRTTSGNGSPGTLPRTDRGSTPAPTISEPAQRAGTLPQVFTTAATSAGPASQSAPALPSHGTAVIAPLKGIFYGRPDPASPPFVTVGATVSAITTVGLVEVMKVFNAVAAGHAGTVAEICVEDGNAVEAGQTLIRIVPDSSSSA